MELIEEIEKELERLKIKEEALLTLLADVKVRKVVAWCDLNQMKGRKLRAKVSVLPSKEEVKKAKGTLLLTD